MRHDEQTNEYRWFLENVEKPLKEKEDTYMEYAKRRNIALEPLYVVVGGSALFGYVILLAHIFQL